MESEILVESQTLSTPLPSGQPKSVLKSRSNNLEISPLSKSVKLAMLDNESLKASAQTVRLQNSLSALKTNRSPFLPRVRAGESPIATSTPASKN